MSEPLLFLAQRIPYPPEKGEKIRAWRVLQHLARRFEVHLGCLHDAPEDARHIPFLKGLCAEVCCPPLVPWQAKLKSLARLGSGEPLTLGYFENTELRRWVEATLAAKRPARVYVFCSAMASYVRHYKGAVRVLDMVDVDSDKWRQYAATRAAPFAMIYRREYRTLENFERIIACEFDATLLVSDAEAQLFRTLAPDAAARVHTLANGIDPGYFDPGRSYPNPYPRKAPVALFTGAMDYWPNVEGVLWFTAEILPRVRRQRPDFEFFIVGLNPTPAVRALAREPGVTVTGRVEDVRPYLAHADAVVAPLRIARGVQNKVLEAMAMARPVVATPEACQGIAAAPGAEVLVAARAEEFAAYVLDALDGRASTLGARARARIVRDYRWNFTLLDSIMNPPPGPLSTAEEGDGTHSAKLMKC